MRDVDYVVLRNGEELQSFMPDWTELWERDPCAKPFQRPEWLIPWWHRFGHQDSRGVVLRHLGETVGFLPFYVYPDAKTGERQLLLMGVGTTDYLDGVFAPECSVECVEGALEMLRREDGWDVLCAAQLSAEGKLTQALERFTGASGFETESCSRLPAAAFGELPQKIRRNAMYYRNRAQRLGRLELRMADEANCLEAFEALVQLHTERWQARGESGVLADPKVLAWHREALPGLARSGLLRLCTLHLHDEVLGVLYSLVDPPGREARTQYFYLPGFSMAHAELRPGTLLQAFAMDAAANEGVQTIDMLRGDESYKQMWHPEPLPTRGFSLRRSAHGGIAEEAA